MSKKFAKPTVKTVKPAEIKTPEVKVETAVKPEAVKEEPKTPEVKEDVKKEEPIKEAVKETAKEATEAVKTTAATAAKAVKKATVKTKKAAVAVKEKTEPEVFVEYNDDNGDHSAKLVDLVEQVKALYVADGHRESSIKSLQVYVKPQDYKAYYVINGKIKGDINLF